MSLNKIHLVFPLVSIHGLQRRIVKCTFTCCSKTVEIISMRWGFPGCLSSLRFQFFIFIFIHLLLLLFESSISPGNKCYVSLHVWLYIQFASTAITEYCWRGENHYLVIAFKGNFMTFIQPWCLVACIARRFLRTACFLSTSVSFPALDRSTYRYCEIICDA